VKPDECLINQTEYRGRLNVLTGNIIGGHQNVLIYMLFLN